MRGRGLPLCARGVSVPTSTKPKPMARSCARHARILVEARRHAERIGKIETAQILAPAADRRAGGAGIKPKLEDLDGEVMRALGVERMEQGLAEAEQRIHGQTPSGRRWRPSVSQS